jgi:hypothetical protein
VDLPVGAKPWSDRRTNTHKLQYLFLFIERLFIQMSAVSPLAIVAAKAVGKSLLASAISEDDIAILSRLPAVLAQVTDEVN